MSKKQELSILEEVVISKIYFIRGQKVMLDRDLSGLYDIDTKQLKRQVRRNMDRFPEDFMFEMTKEEFENWRCQFGTSNSSDKMGLRYVPFCFTEQGVAMLSSVLNSPTAIKVNIRIIRVFTKLRQALTDTVNLKLEIEEIKKKLSSHSKNIELVFSYLDELIEKKENPVPRPRVGFKTNRK
ncbi:ORF6N domain-containing protein [Sinomicrobium weinanense]|uniref:ORF6N domain-containing protein n=1 Tax=Sinomicrobium weinanense TaxID=2842200 RepID=A0A926JQJ8_9FLAO|nr:ORF6N domain-containing protein [Sinomicrobium weinanense]MBC9795468.1 ORF6N domain-containing protein [Sinomicrobium weinanense]MBU3123993.1 ORF6N domain-containing protein [Sinomicrobium weinanense]